MLGLSRPPSSCLTSCSTCVGSVNSSIVLQAIGLKHTSRRFEAYEGRSNSCSLVLLEVSLVGCKTILHPAVFLPHRWRIFGFERISPDDCGLSSIPGASRKSIHRFFQHGLLSIGTSILSACRGIMLDFLEWMEIGICRHRQNNR
jgi:hypothetical protein